MSFTQNQCISMEEQACRQQIVVSPKSSVVDACYRTGAYKLHHLMDVQYEVEQDLRI
jgi:hypothetical protein